MRFPAISLLCFFTLLVFVTYGGLETLFRPVSGVHMWRQSDAASQTLNFYQNNLPFWQPQVHSRVSDDGFAASEFPILYWTVGKLYHVFGPKQIWLLRALSFGLFLWGLLCLYRVGEKWLSNAYLALVPPLFLLTSPYVFYYALNMLPNVPALSLSLVGLYAWEQCRERFSVRRLLLAVLVSGLAGMIKVTDGGIVLLAAFVTYFFEDLAKLRYRKEVNWSDRLFFWSGVLAVLLSWVAWNYYAKAYNEHYHSVQNLLGIYPIWEMSWEEPEGVRGTLKAMARSWWPDYHFRIVLSFLGALALAAAWFWSSLDVRLKGFFRWILWGTLAYALCWFRAFYHHDYYQLPLVLIGLFLLFPMLKWLSVSNLWKKVSLRYAFAVVGTLLLIGAVVHGRKRQIHRYEDKVYQYINPHLYTMEPYLRSLGIGREERIVSVPDPSPNMTLYQLNNPGMTELFINPDNFDLKAYARQNACKYVVVSDSGYLSRPEYAPYLQQPIGNWNGILVFRLD